MSKKLKSKNNVHVIHHTHWDFEWYFTMHDTDALLNFDINHILDKLEQDPKKTFLFDGQTAPFENYKNDSFKLKRIKKLVKNKQLKIGPWYSQPDMRQTTEEGLIRNYEYGSYFVGLKTDHYDYIYTPDSFGFSENIPIIYKFLGKKNALLWRGVNREIINDNPYFEWKASNGDSVNVYNMASGYFVGRYLYDDDSINDLYKNNLLPSIKYQSHFGKYKEIAIPTGGDQQPYNEKLDNAIKKLNQKKDGNNYFLSTWNDFFKAFVKQNQSQKKISYNGQLVYAFGGRLHKTIGSHRPDIKELIFKTELSLSRVLEPLFMLSSLGRNNYPQVQLDAIWKKLLLSQAHDSYASCNSDQVNDQIKNRLLIAKNKFEANKDMLIRLMSKNSKNDTISIFNPTNFEGNNLFKILVATKSKNFDIVDEKNNKIDFIIEKTQLQNGGKKVIYTGNGEKEIPKDNYFLNQVLALVNVNDFSIKKLKLVDRKNKVNNLKVSKIINIEYNKKQFFVNDNKKSYQLDLMFKLDNGDGYDIDILEEYSFFALKHALLLNKEVKTNNGIKISKFSFEINLPKNTSEWKEKKESQKTNFLITFIEIKDELKVKLKFQNVPYNILCQLMIKNFTNQKDHLVASYAGIVKRKNDVKNNVKNKKNLLRETINNFDIAHGYIKSPFLDVASLNIREYQIKNDQDLILNVFRTPDVLGRENLKTRPGRASGLPDITIFTPKTKNVIKEVEFAFNVFVHQDNHFKYVEKMLIEKLTRHNQNLYRYHNRTETWTLPNIKISDSFIDNYINVPINLNIIAWYYHDNNEIIRINNPSLKKIVANLIIFGSHKKVIFKANEIKEFKQRKKAHNF